MANILQNDPRFGLSGNTSHQTSLQTLNKLLDPNLNAVSKLPRLQQERNIIGAEAQKKQAFAGDFARANIGGSRIKQTLGEAVTETATQEIGMAQLEEVMRQGEQDRLAMASYLDLVLSPNIAGAGLNEQEKQLRLQLKQLKGSASTNKLMGTLMVIGGIAMSVFSFGTLAAVGIPMAAQGASMVAG